MSNTSETTEEAVSIEETKEDLHLTLILDIFPLHFQIKVLLTFAFLTFFLFSFFVMGEIYFCTEQEILRTY